MNDNLIRPANSQVRGRFAVTVGLIVGICFHTMRAADSLAEEEPHVMDLSLMVSAELPGTWPAAGFPPFHINHYQKIGPLERLQRRHSCDRRQYRHAARRADRIRFRILTRNFPTPAPMAECLQTRCRPGSSLARRA